VVRLTVRHTELDIRLVFTDIDMPGSMNGMKLAAAVREKWPPIHIIITSGKGRPVELPELALVIPKPYLGRNVVEGMRTFDNMSQQRSSGSVGQTESLIRSDSTCANAKYVYEIYLKLRILIGSFIDCTIGSAISAGFAKW
jgi:hypothetical protein